MAIDKVKVIQSRLKVAQDRQKSYADNWRKDIEFEVGYWVFFKVISLERCGTFWKVRKVKS